MSNLQTGFAGSNATHPQASVAVSAIITCICTACESHRAWLRAHRPSLKSPPVTALVNTFVQGLQIRVPQKCLQERTLNDVEDPANTRPLRLRYRRVVIPAAFGRTLGHVRLNEGLPQHFFTLISITESSDDREKKAPEISNRRVE